MQLGRGRAEVEAELRRLVVDGNPADRIPPQTAAMMEGAASAGQLPTDGLAGRASAWRPPWVAAGAGGVRGRADWGPSGGARGAFWSRACSIWHAI